MGHWGCPGGQIFYFKHGHVAYQIDGDDKQNRIQVTFSSYGQTGDLGARSKDQISLTCQFQRFLYQALGVFSQIKDRKHIEQNFHSVARVMPQGWTCGCWGESKTLAWGFAMGPHRLHALVGFMIRCMGIIYISGPLPGIWLTACMADLTPISRCCFLEGQLS